MTAIDLIVRDLKLLQRLRGRSEWKRIGVGYVAKFDQQIETRSRRIRNGGIGRPVAARVGENTEGKALVLAKLWRGLKRAFGDVSIGVDHAIVISVTRPQAI